MLLIIKIVIISANQRLLGSISVMFFAQGNILELYICKIKILS